VFGHGHFIALVGGKGIFEADLKRSKMTRQLRSQLVQRARLRPVQYKKLQLRDRQFERRLKPNFHHI
jgi:hypothetical protein